MMSMTLCCLGPIGPHGCESCICDLQIFQLAALAASGVRSSYVSDIEKRQQVAIEIQKDAEFVSIGKCADMNSVLISAVGFDGLDYVRQNSNLNP